MFSRMRRRPTPLYWLGNCLLCGMLAALLVPAGAAAGAAEPGLVFNRDVRPILSENCFRCHGPDAASREADLRLDEREAALIVIEPERPDDSEMIRRILSDDPGERMPPADSGKQLSDEQQQVLVRWVREGAKYQAHWSFIPPERGPLPDMKNDAWPVNEIDFFVLDRLQQEGLAPSPEADRVTLIRRVTLDLTGLPPTPAEVDAFLADDSDDAYEQLIDRLLASQRYGEHLAAEWLEAARYADTDGYQNDRYRYQHAWRDWAVMALNENLPYDRFVTEQLAGDMLPGATLKQQIATGFCRNHRINSEAGSIPAEWHVENVVDRVDTLGTVFLGLTVGCARCHDHKYDPITQTDYYRLFAYFNNVPESGIGPNNGNSPPFIDVPAGWPNLSKAENQFIEPAPLEFQKGQYSGGVVRPKPGGKNTVMVMHEMDEPRPTYLLRRGMYNQPDKSRVLKPGVPAALDAVGEAEPSNRLELARWLVHPRNPLTARVAVNRLWQRLFGVGLVKTSENFGSQGEAPSHPELLDWLATEFIELGWDMKALQKKILLSATYRQSSEASPELVRRDPENRLLARGPRFRLTAFVLRDQALAASGLLVEKLGGEPVKPYMPPKIWKSISNNAYKQDHGESLYRRSLYTYWRRTIPPPAMVNFNAADREVCSVRRERTNTPLQALTLMNNVVFVESARFLAERMIREGGETLEGRIVRGFRLATARRPRAEELAVLLAAHQDFAARYRDDEAAAKELLGVGEKPRDASLEPREHAALTMTASLILNLDETITKE